MNQENIHWVVSFLLSYILRDVSFEEVDIIYRVAFREPIHLCTFVKEEGDDGESVCSETPSLLSYTLRYVSFTEVDPRTDAPVYMHERGGGRRGIYVLRNAISAVIHLDRQCSEGFFFSSISFFLSFSLFFTFFTKALHESSQKMASTSQCVGTWQTVRSGCTAGGRAGYVAASESVSSSFCAVSLEKILHGLPDRPKRVVPGIYLYNYCDNYYFSFRTRTVQKLKKWVCTGRTVLIQKLK